ncbi:Arabidopsis Toxicos en Levadura 51 [Hibiscus trionum]|uniref:Arabidopsis Toxicos en Levadura 51 n=1 Tax=Hibiscus trionum TaxID=183268 RepID=A0A9W7I0R7_HIBTR|nr:Arabidopsis Toxicos en Levadura 51 [Hibiscus trionum]
MSSSSSTPNPWTPYETFKDCSQGICSMICPQWCYFVFPPPPPFPVDDHGFSPLIIAFIGILASAFILVSYYTIISKYCTMANWFTRAG